jgi:hypothetical protein
MDDSEEATPTDCEQEEEEEEEVGSSCASASCGSCKPIKGDAKLSGRGPKGG